MISAFRRSALAIGATALLAATASALPAAAQPKRGGVLTYALTGEPSNFDCAAGTNFGALQTLRPHYSGLINFDPDSYPNVKADVAARWDVSADRLTYTFHLRRDVVFHDGSPLTAADVKATFERLRKPPNNVVSVRQARYADISAIETPDAHTVIFRLSQPDSAIMSTFASPWNCIYPAAKLNDDPRWPEKNILGSGPFRFVRYTPGSEWVGERFDKYFEPGKPYLDGFHVVFMNTGKIVTSFLGQQIDAYFVGNNPSEVRQVTEKMGDKITAQESPWLSKYDVFFNTKAKPFDDPRVRQALTMAVDRWNGVPSLAKITTVGHVGGVLRPGAALATPVDELAKLKGYSRDMTAARAEARRLLADAGVKDLKFKLTTRNLDTWVPLMVFLIDQWRQIGVTVEGEANPVGQQKARYLAGNYQVGMDVDSYEDDEPNELLLRYVSISRSPRNFGHYEDPVIDSLYDRQKSARTDADRQALIRDLERRNTEQAWVFPLAWMQRVVLHRSELQGWKVLPSQFLNQDLASVWLEKPTR